MDWQNPELALPEDGETIWILDQHRNKNGALSCEIIGATARNIKTEFSDVLVAENGEGSHWRTWVLKDRKNNAKKEDYAAAWCQLCEIPLPGFLEHRRKST